MAVKPSVVSTTNLDQAAGSNTALRTMLQQLSGAANAQATKTNTSGKTAPNQSSATATFKNPLYIITFTDPGGGTTLSLAQQAQQAAAATLGSNPTLSNIYHQVQAATSILFDSPAGVTTYGGDTGSLQAQFIIGDLDTAKNWYFRVRTSYDGVTWNQWRIINSKSTSVNVDAVSAVPVNGGQWAKITLPGKQVIGFGIGQLPTGNSIQTAQGVTLANTMGIAAPASYVGGPVPAYGVTTNQINGNGVVSIQYTGKDGATWPGNANFVTFGWVPGGTQNLAEQVLGDGGRWIVFTVSGGCRVAIGVGTAANGQTIQYPTGFSAANSMGAVSPLVVNATEGYAHGIRQATLDSSGLVTCLYDAVSGTATSSANWFAVAWEAPLNANLVPVSGGQFLRLPTPAGDVMLGCGSTHGGSYIELPIGYGVQNCLTFSTPGSDDYTSDGTVMHGVEVCTIDTGLTTSTGLVTCLYTDGGPQWSGDARWFAVCWPLT